MRTKVFSTAVLVVMCLLLRTPAEGATVRYVDGSLSATCSDAAVAGDTIYIRAGTYTGSVGGTLMQFHTGHQELRGTLSHVSGEAVN